MEQHPPGDGRIEHPRPDTATIGTQGDHVNMLLDHEFLDRQKQVAIAQDRVIDVRIGILFLEILAHTRQTDLIPFITAGRDIKQMDLDILSLDQSHELVKSD